MKFGENNEKKKKGKKRKLRVGKMKSLRINKKEMKKQMTASKSKAAKENTIATESGTFFFFFFDKLLE